MLAYYFEPGPRQGVGELYTAGGHLPIGGSEATAALKRAGIKVNDGGDALFLKREKLEPVPGAKTDKAFTLSELEALLRASGPILISWTKLRTRAAGGAAYGHACVLIGTDDAAGKVTFHDPENAPNSQMKVGTFNELLFRSATGTGMLRRRGVVSGQVRTGTAPGGAGDGDLGIGGLFG